MIWIFCRSSEGRKNKLLAQMCRWIFPTSFTIFLIHGKIRSVMQMIWVKYLGAENVILLMGYFILPILVIVVCIVVDVQLRKVPIYRLQAPDRK